MIKKVYVVIYIVIASIFLGWGDKILPSRNEISKLELSRVVGYDVGDEEKKARFSLVVDSQEDSQNENGSSGQGGSSKKKEKVVSVTADTFVMCFRALQGYRDKTLITGHIKNILIGEEAARNGIIEELDSAARNYDLRFDTNVYLIKGSSAKDFLLTGTESLPSMEESIENLMTTMRGNAGVGDYELVDILKMTTSEEKSGLIPALEMVTEDDKLKAWEIESSEDEGKSGRMEIVGFGIMKDGKLIDFLTEAEFGGFNVMNENFTGFVIELQSGEEKVGVGLSDIKVKRNFVFEDSKVKEIVLDIKVEGDVTEVSTGRNIFESGLSFYEQQASDMIKAYVATAVKKSQETGVDFLKLEQALKIKHPYRYEKMKDAFLQDFQTLPVIVNVETTINKTFGMFSVVDEKWEG